jgi:type IV pilus biogenesis protein CpaD/CtpE
MVDLGDPMTRPVTMAILVALITGCAKPAGQTTDSRPRTTTSAAPVTTIGDPHANFPLGNLYTIRGISLLKPMTNINRNNHR